MPTNVSFEYAIAESKYDAAKTDDEKIIALQDMISKAPSHKGGENLRKELSRKLSALKTRIIKQAAAAKKSGNTINIKKEGAGQIVVVGLPNSGKSTFLSYFTNAKPLIAPYPFTTKRPEVGVLNFGGAIIQLIEVPSFLENQELATQVYSMMRVADAIILVIKDGSKDELDVLITKLERKDVFITHDKPKIDIIRSEYNGVSFVNEQNLLIPKEQAVEFLKNAGFRSHNIILNEKTSLDDLVRLINPRACFVKTVAVSMPFTKTIKPFVYRNIQTFDLSQKQEITEEIFRLINKNIIHTKKPGQKADTNEPLVLDQGATVLDAAKAIHKTFAKNLKYARVWGSTKFPGMTVSKNYVLKNKDVVEFTI